MRYSPDSIEKVIEVLSSLPTIGKKTAQRLTYHILRQSDEFAQSIADSVTQMKKNIKLCSTCYNYTDSDPCPICKSHKRHRETICVVEEPGDVNSIEKTGEYFGLYHVLHGVLNPLEGITQDDIRIKELVPRVKDIDEIILAINPSVEGEVTMHYISKILKPFEVNITKIASGVPIGSSLEYADEATISRALEGRIKI